MHCRSILPCLFGQLQCFGASFHRLNLHSFRPNHFSSRPTGSEFHARFMGFSTLSQECFVDPPFQSFNVSLKVSRLFLWTRDVSEWPLIYFWRAFLSQRYSIVHQGLAVWKAFHRVYLESLGLLDEGIVVLAEGLETLKGDSLLLTTNFHCQ